MSPHLPTRVEHWPLDRLLPYAANARSHSDEQVRQLAGSIAGFGFNVPCLVDDAGVLIAGHGRLLAARQLGLAEVPVIRLTDRALKQDLSRNHRIHPVLCRPEGDKVARLMAASLAIEKGQVHLPEEARWLETFRSEIMSFPAARHDDQVDSLSQFLNWNHTRTRVYSGYLNADPDDPFD